MTPEQAPLHHHTFIQWFNHLNWFLIAPAMVGCLNVVVAGARVMGWTQLATFCGKLEDAIQAMVTAALTRKQQGVTNAKPNASYPPDTVA